MSLSVFRWLSSSICSSLPSIPLIFLVLDGERFCHTERAQQSYKCPVALIKRCKMSHPPFTRTVEGGDFQDTFPPELFGWLPWPSSVSEALRLIWCHVNACLVVRFRFRIKKNGADARKDKFSWNFENFVSLRDKVSFSLMFFIAVLLSESYGGEGNESHWGHTELETLLCF